MEYQLEGRAELKALRGPDGQGQPVPPVPRVEGADLHAAARPTLAQVNGQIEPNEAPTLAQDQGTVAAWLKVLAPCARPGKDYCDDRDSKDL